MKFVLTILVFTLSSLQLVATITLQFSGVSGVADGFRNSSGSIDNNGRYGLVFDLSGGSTGFSSLINPSASSSTLDSFDINLNNQLIAPNLSYRFGGGVSEPSQFSSAAGSGGAVTTITNISYTDLSSGDPFGIIWFPSSGLTASSVYGFLTDPGFTTPGDSESVSFETLSVWDGTGDFQPTNFTAIPEPSAYATILGLLGLGYAVFCRRRRTSPRE